MKNFISEGKTIQFTASGQSYVSGQPVPIGDNFGIAEVDIADGSTGTASTTGVHRLKKKASLAITQGDKLFWDPINKEITKTALDGSKIGWAHASVAGSATTVDVMVVVSQLQLDAELVSIAVTPASPSKAHPSTQQFVATGTYTNGSTAVITGSVTWASATPAKATINGSGLATTVAAGTTVISATLGLIVGQTTLTVT